MERRLAAILAADVVGYARLMSEDETGTFERLKSLRRKLVQPTIAEHSGRIVKLMGDGLLAEFPSVVEAVRCAGDIQRGMAEQESAIDDHRRVALRIGVNLGDIIVEGSDIYGDGVNVAARLEGLAHPGGICVSGTVFDHVKDKVDVEFEDLGEQRVKNIGHPIRVYRVALNGERVRSDAAATSPGDETGPQQRDVPSVVVLPFENMSGDAEQDYFADGITEEITTELSRFRNLLVISRNSAFTYKGKATNIQDVAKDLAVQYVVEGSVRKAGNRVRVTAQLVDAETDRHVWAERFDRDLEDIFDVQDEITTAIVAILPGRIEAATQERAERKRPENLFAYECVLGGRVLHHRSSMEDNDKALHLLEQAIEIDPTYAHAHAWKGCVLGQAWVHGWCDDPDTTWDQVVEEVQLALTLDDDDSGVHRILAAINVAHNDLDKAWHHQERGLHLNPNNDLIVVQQGELLTWLGRPDEGITWIQKAMRLNPFHPERYWNHLGRAYFVAHRYAEAIDSFERISTPNHMQHADLAACHAQKGDEKSARSHADQVTRLEPTFAVEPYLDKLHYKHETDRQHHREGLLKAGLPN